MDNETLNYKFENFEILAIPDFPNYFISTDGDVYSINKGNKIKKLKPRYRGKRIDRIGYKFVTLYRDKKKYGKSIHQLVAQIFLYRDNNKDQVDHINNNIIDNRLENLRWVTKSENIRNRKKTKSNKSGILGVYFMKPNYWVAHWTDFDGKRQQKLFPTQKYGENKAKQLAINLRKEMEKIYYPTKLTDD